MAKRWQRLADDALSGVYPALEAMSDGELRNLRGATHKRSSTNCWWFTYQCIPALSDAADLILRMRQRDRRMARAAEKRKGK